MRLNAAPFGDKSELFYAITFSVCDADDRLLGNYALLHFLRLVYCDIFSA